MSDVKIPRHLAARLDAAGRKHGFASGEPFASHLVQRGLRQHQVSQAVPLPAQLEEVVEAQGYSSVAELVEHLLERGLRAYEEPESDPGKLEARLRGLGYID